VAGKDETLLAAGEDFAKQLSEKGLKVLLDDRKASPGVKFADAELVGVPTILVIGRGLKDGVVEVKDRKSGDRVDVPVAEVVDHLVQVVRG
jgi:prolyl-tRNA synthetase